MGGNGARPFVELYSQMHRCRDAEKAAERGGDKRLWQAIGAQRRDSRRAQYGAPGHARSLCLCFAGKGDEGDAFNGFTEERSEFAEMDDKQGGCRQQHQYPSSKQKRFFAQRHPHKGTQRGGGAVDDGRWLGFGWRRHMLAIEAKRGSDKLAPANTAT